MLSDNFNRSDGTLGVDWDEYVGAPEVYSNQARHGSGNNFATHATSVGSTDMSIAATCASLVAGGLVSVAGRSGAADQSGIHFVVSNNTDTMTLYARSAAGAWTELEQTSEAPPSTPFTLRIELEGTTVRGYVNDALKVTATGVTDFAAQTRAGFYMSGGSSASATLDDWSADVLAVGDSIAIASPTANQGFYAADGSGHSVTVSGSYSGSPTAVEARVDSGGWATLDAAPTAGAFSGSVALAKSLSPHTIEVRFANDTGVTDSVGGVLVAKYALLVAGQSNAGGRGANLQSVADTSRSRLYNGGWGVVDDPCCDATDPTAAGSMWPLLVDLLNADGEPVVLVTAPRGATGLVTPANDWDDGGVHYDDAVDAATASGINGFAAVLWHQGESDAVSGVSQAAYQAALADLYDRFAADLPGGGAPLIVAQLAEEVNADDDDLDAIRDAQLAAVDDSTIFLGPVLHDLDLSDGSGDGVHLKTDGELTAGATRYYYALLAALAGGSEHSPLATEATYLGDAVTVTFDRTLTTAPSLSTGAWGVVDGAGARTVLSAAASGSAVTLTLDQSLAAPVTVRLGSGGGGAGAVVPTSAIGLPAAAQQLPATQLVPALPFLLEEAMVAAAGAEAGIALCAGGWSVSAAA